MKKLNECRVVVTGAANGIGKAIAKEFAKQGSTLLLSDINEASLIAVQQECLALGSQVKIVVADIGTVEGAHAIVDTCIEKFKGIDVLINNAGILTQAPLVDLTYEMWERMIRIDLTSVFLTTQRALPYMIEQKWGRVINVASQLGIKGGVELSHYCAAKAGVIGFSKAVAREVAKDNVLVNCIAPGPVFTSLVGGLSDDWQKEKAKELPLERFGTPEEVAPVAVLLASEPGGNLFVGQTLGPNSGDVMP